MSKKTRLEILRDIATANLIEIQHDALVKIKEWLEAMPLSAKIEAGIADRAIKAHKDYQNRSWLK
jgi:hypothetical protein